MTDERKTCGVCNHYTDDTVEFGEGFGECSKKAGMRIEIVSKVPPCLNVEESHYLYPDSDASRCPCFERK